MRTWVESTVRTWLWNTCPYLGGVDGAHVDGLQELAEVRHEAGGRGRQAAEDEIGLNCIKSMNRPFTG